MPSTSCSNPGPLGLCFLCYIIVWQIIGVSGLWLRVRLNETGLLSTQNICLKLCVRKYLQLYTDFCFCLSKPRSIYGLFQCESRTALGR